MRLAALAVGVLAALALVAWLAIGRGSGAGAVPRTAVEAEQGVERRIRVEVLNAAGIPRLAQRGTDRLRDEGFDVVYFGNAHGFHQDTSLVLDRVGDAEAARKVAEAIGVGRVRTVPDSSLYLEVTVVLGTDWEEP